MYSRDFYAIMRTEEECITSEGHDVGTHAAAFLKDMYDGLVAVVSAVMIINSSLKVIERQAGMQWFWNMPKSHAPWK